MKRLKFTKRNVGLTALITIAGIVIATTISLISIHLNKDYENNRNWEFKVKTIKEEKEAEADEKYHYYNALQQTPNTIPYYKKKIENLELENRQLKQKLRETGEYEPDELSFYYTKESLGIGEAFVDPLTQATIGVSDIHMDFTADISLLLPGMEKTKTEKGVVAGASWTYVHSEILFILSIVKIDWFSDRVIFEINEARFEDHDLDDPGRNLLLQ